jgi:hypothetical protein
VHCTASPLVKPDARTLRGGCVALDGNSANYTATQADVRPLYLVGYLSQRRHISLLTTVMIITSTTFYRTHSPIVRLLSSLTFIQVLLYGNMHIVSVLVNLSESMFPMRDTSFALFLEDWFIIISSHITDTTPPLVVLNAFGQSDESQVKLMKIAFQNMFPTINTKTVRLSDCKRVVLFHYKKEVTTHALSCVCVCVSAISCYLI